MSWFDEEPSLPICYAPIVPVYSKEQCAQRAKNFLDEILSSKGKKFTTTVICACCKKDFSYLPSDVKCIMDTGFCGYCFRVKKANDPEFVKTYMFVNEKGEKEIH